MSHSQKFIAIASLFFVLSLPSIASASARLSLVGVGDYSNFNISPLPAGESTSSKWGLGGGALLDFTLERHVDFETGALYITRRYGIATSATTENWTEHAVQVPVLLRVWLHPMFSLAAGGYAAIGTGNVMAKDTATGVTTTETYSTSGLSNRDYGLLFSASIRLPISSSTGFLVDGRYALGMTNANADKSSTTTYKYTDVQVLAGLQFGFQMR